jgi:hypothetical protein
MVYRLLFAIRAAGYIALRFFLKKSNNYQNEIEVAKKRINKYDQDKYDEQ